jgi:prepilin-type N-terminal cleavage/methylation domain-containing protein
MSFFKRNYLVKKTTSAFTMLELVMVVVVLGILASLALPRFDTKKRQEAADNILSSIRFTQSLALLDNKNDRTEAGLDTNGVKTNWQKGLWHIRFDRYANGAKWFYTVSSSMDGSTNVDKGETAIDASNGKFMYNLAGNGVIGDDESPNIFISEKYGIDNVDFTNCTGDLGRLKSSNTATHLAFDYMGRPHKGIYGATNNYATVMHEDCIIRFTFLDESEPLDIQINSETGYAFLVGQLDS